jgi:hypothetical protein
LRTAWGAFRAIRMTGVDDRGDFYRFWYATVDLEDGERLVAGWKAVLGPRSWFGALWGNLLVSDRRLIFEPYSSKRVAYAPHGMKLVINGMAKLAERKAPPIPVAVALSDISTVERTGTESMSTLTVTDRWGNAREFLLSATRPPIGAGHQQRRDAAALRIGAALRS